MPPSSITAPARTSVLEQPFEYLASPYSDPDARIRQQRYEAVCRAAAGLMLQGRVIYCPIAHSHPIEAHMFARQSHDFWLAQCRPLLQKASGLLVLCLPGWQDSRGVQEEERIATIRRIPIEYLQPWPWLREEAA